MEKSIKVFATSEVDIQIFETVRSTFKIISNLAGLKKEIKVELADFSNYRLTGEYFVLDKVFEKSMLNTCYETVDLGSLFGILSSLIINTLGENYLESYYLLITKKYDLKMKEANFVIGGGLEKFGAIISLLRTTGENLPKDKIPKNTSFDNFEKEMIVTQVLHEFGHVFGCAKVGRRYTVDYLGSHDDAKFIDNCVMLQGVSVPDDWIEMTKKRLISKQTFCKLCRTELKEYFST